MMRRAIPFFWAVILAAVAADCLGRTIYVDTTPTSDPNGSPSNPFTRIQDAIDVASDADTIKIRPGIYTGAGNRDIDPLGLSLIITSIDPNDLLIVESTIIDPNALARGFYIHSDEDSSCIISGLTIRNAYGNGVGGGIYCQDASPLIEKCLFIGNEAVVEGGAVDCSNASPKIKNCLIIANNARYGGAVGAVEDSSPEIVNCTILKNTALFTSGGLYCFSYSHAHVKNSIIRNNELIESSPEFPYQIGLEYQCELTMSYTDIQDGPDGISSIQSTVNYLTGNIDEDPNFVYFDADTEPQTWNLFLQSQYGRWDKDSSQWLTDSFTSPCIDAGDPTSDYLYEPWPNGKRINMGAYGGTICASKNGNIADFDVSGSVNVDDLLHLTGEWMQETTDIVNLDQTGPVSLNDFAIFSANWLWQKQ